MILSTVIVQCEMPIVYAKFKDRVGSSSGQLKAVTVASAGKLVPVCAPWHVACKCMHWLDTA